MKRLIVIFLFIATVAYGQYDHEQSHVGSDTGPEKAMILKDVNYARTNPQTYGNSIDVDLSQYPSMGRLDTLYKLNFNAQWYAEKLLERAPYNFDHSGMPSEVLLWNYDVCVSIDQFIIDKNVPDLAHRRMLLNPEYTQVGIGIAKGWVGDWYRTYVVMLME